MQAIAILFGLAVFSPAIWRVVTQAWRNPDAISTPTWLAATNALFIFVGPLVTLLFFAAPDSSASSQSWKIVYVTVAYFATLAAVYTVIWKGVLGGFVGSRQSHSAIATLRHSIVSAKPAEVLLVGGALVAITTWLNAVYALNVSGGGDYFKMARLPYAVVVLNTLTMPLTLGAAAAFAWLASSRQQSQVRLVAAVLLIVMVGNTLAAGRRELLWLGAMIGLGVLWSGRKRLGLAVPIVAVFAYVILFIFAPIFLRARLIYSSPNSPGVAAAFRIAAEEQRSAVVDETGDTLRENMSWRFNTILFWEDMYAARSPGEFDGQILAQGVMMALPRALVGFSKYRLGAVDEAVLGTGDICNNISLESFLDLGYIGPVVYGVIFGLLYAMADFLLVLTAFRTRVLAILSSSVLIRLLLGPEVNLITCFSDFRTLLIYFLVALLIAMLFGRRPMHRLDSAGRPQPWSGQSRIPFAAAAVPSIAGPAPLALPPRDVA
jgi:hypothetical protein